MEVLEVGAAAGGGEWGRGQGALQEPQEFDKQK
jgi:hypothetical protein